MAPAHEPSSRTGRSTRVEIDLAAFESNLSLAASLGGERREVMAVLKADGYGHGAVPLARRAIEAGASMIGVATVEEARALRRAGLTAPILLLSEPHPGSAPEVAGLGAAAVVYSAAACEALDAAARNSGSVLPVHLKIDTGMGRVGESPKAALLLVAKIRRMPNLVLEGLLSHLSEADRLDTGYTFHQLKQFASACRRICRGSHTIRYFHIANSALLMRGESVGNMTRPGIMLYGAPPAPGFPGSSRLSPVMRFVTEVAFLKEVAAGSRLSYGGTFQAQRKSTIATLPVGYADGYRRGLSNRAEVLVRGRRAPQVGTICMDLTLVDVTGIPGVAVGDEVVLIGRQDDQEITADELAGHLGTISYEVFCGVSTRVPRRYFNGSRPGGSRGEATPPGGGRD